MGCSNNPSSVGDGGIARYPSAEMGIHAGMADDSETVGRKVDGSSYTLDAQLVGPVGSPVKSDGEQGDATRGSGPSGGELARLDVTGVWFHEAIDGPGFANGLCGYWGVLFGALQVQAVALKLQSRPMLSIAAPPRCGYEMPA